jgi:hypothetical protein
MAGLIIKTWDCSSPSKITADQFRMGRGVLRNRGDAGGGCSKRDGALGPEQARN